MFAHVHAAFSLCKTMLSAQPTICPRDYLLTQINSFLPAAPGEILPAHCPRLCEDGSISYNCNPKKEATSESMQRLVEQRYQESLKGFKGQGLYVHV